MERGERESNSYDDVIFEEELVQKKGLEGSEWFCGCLVLFNLFLYIVLL